MIVSTFLFLVAVSTASSLNFEMFREHSFKDLAYQLKEKELPTCHNIRDYAQGIVKSVRADSCVILYEQKYCEGYSLKLMPPGNPNLGVANGIASFHICNGTHGGDLIRADLYSNNDLIMEYASICGCQNLLQEVSDKVNRINNYGNCIKIFPIKNCEGNGLEVYAGKNLLSEHVNRDFQPMSISACGTRPSCYKFTAEIYKVDVTFPSDVADYLKTIELGERTRFYNNGSGTVIQQYDSSKTIHQSFVVSKNEIISGMEKYSMELNYEMKIESDPNNIFSLISIQLQKALASAYMLNQSGRKDNSEKYLHTEQHIFNAKETIDIPPCVEYELLPTLQIYENIPISYKIYAKVSGFGGDQQISTNKLKALLTEMEFIETDEREQYTGRFKSRESDTIKATFGVSTYIQGEGRKMEACALAMRQDICQNLNSYALGKFKGIYRSTCCN